METKLRAKQRGLCRLNRVGVPLFLSIKICDNLIEIFEGQLTLNGFISNTQQRLER
jgi:hypothetical protein